nr:MAG TPA: hypothetical protein [Caudoviricetes sp.]
MTAFPLKFNHSSLHLHFKRTVMLNTVLFYSF